jgi:alpha-tubulin suppressor-like RCC1 family protein
MRTVEVSTILLVALCPAISVVQAAQGGSLCAWGDNSCGQCDVPPGNDFVAVAGGWSHSLALKTDGSIVAWGDNGHSQCSVPSPNSGFVAVAAGGYHNLGLKSDGSIVAWGDNTYGQCTVPSPNTGFVAIDAGRDHSLGLKSDGSVVAWGRNSQGQCNLPSPNTGFIRISGGADHSLGLTSDGSVVSWGYNNVGQCDVPLPNTDFIAIAACYKHSLGLKSNGSVVVWGDGGSDLCNVPDPNSGFTAVAGGESNCLGLKGDGSIVAWGYNAYGQCNVPDPNTGFVAVAAGLHHSLAIRAPSALGGTGTDNYIPRWLGTSDLEDSVIYQTDAGNLGIGTTSPACALDVAGAVNLSKGKAGTGAIALTVDGKEALWSNGTYFSWGYGDSWNYFKNSIGIGTTSPQQVLDLGSATSGRAIAWGGSAGTGWYDTIGASYSSAALSLLFMLKTDTAKDQYLVSYTGNEPHAGIRIGDGIHFFAEPYTNRTTGTVFDYAGATRLFIKDDGKVGIGTTDPKGKLDVAREDIILRGAVAVGGDTTPFDASVGSVVVIAGGGGTVNHIFSYDYSAPASSAPRTLVLQNPGGSVAIGTPNPGTYRLAVNGSAAKPGGGSWSSLSDARLKQIRGDYERGLSEVLRLNPVTYSYTADNQLKLPSDRQFVGLVAQEVRETIPEAVEENSDGYLMVNNDPIIWAMANAIKELKQENDQLRKRLEVLEAAETESRSLSQRIEALEQMVRQQGVVAKEVQP